MSQNSKGGVTYQGSWEASEEKFIGTTGEIEEAKGNYP